MTMPGRNWKLESSAYRYGYQGSEINQETHNNSNQYTTEFRQLDARFGRWFSTDHMFFAHQNPYNGMDCNPILYIDPMGGEGIIPESWYSADGWMPPILAGIVDGMYESLNFVAAIEFGVDILTDEETQQAMLDFAQALWDDPGSVMEALLDEYKEKLKNIAEWNDQGQYDLGSIIGEIGGGAAGAGFIKVINKVAKQSKNMQRLARVIDIPGKKTPEGKTSGSPPKETPAQKIEAKVESGSGSDMPKVVKPKDVKEVQKSTPGQLPSASDKGLNKSTSPNKPQKRRMPQAVRDGIEFENSKAKEFNASPIIKRMQRQVSVKAFNKDGFVVWAKVDFVLEMKDGSFKFVEAKLRNTTDLTKNQKIVYAALERGEAWLVGNNAAKTGLPTNQKLDKIKVSRVNKINN